MKVNNIYKKKLILVIAIIILSLLFINLTNLLYYIAYTIDYLINRSTYHFKEEAQYKDNRLIQNDYFLTTFMNNNRNNRLDKLPRIESQPIPELSIQELTKENVEKVSKCFTEPFIVRGLIKEFDCVKKWNLEYFENEYGNIDVPAFSDNKTVSYSRNTSTRLKKCDKDTNLCSIREICDGIKKGEPVYVNNISKLFTVSKQAENELNLHKMSEIMNSSFFKKEKENKFMSQLFLGGKNTGTSLHCASNVNFFFNIKGTKHWGFIHPKYTSIIKCQTSEKGLFAISDDDFFSESENNPFLKIPRYEALLHSGDFLFNPAWYWHAVKNKTDYTIGVANRYIFDLFGEVPCISNNIFFSFLQLFSPSYYLQWASSYDKNKSTQEIYGTIVDKEILNNLSKSNAI
uniref:JmjC domain-containing protein n=1 Tax=viral metagenome TaxID=1070528 RepID=A0A6C0ATY5_9ZZZZ